MNFPQDWKSIYLQETVLKCRKTFFKHLYKVKNSFASCQLYAKNCFKINVRNRFVQTPLSAKKSNES